MPQRKKLREKYDLKRGKRNKAGLQLPPIGLIHPKFGVIVLVALLSIVWKLPFTQERLGGDWNFDLINYSARFFFGFPKLDVGRNVTLEVEKRTPEDKIDVFLSWLIQNGARISEFVVLSEYPDFGGYGLSAIMKDNVPSSIAVVHEFDELFTIPSKLIMTSKSLITKQYSDIPTLQNHLHQIFRHVPSPMVQQDIIIALHLLVENGLGERSTLRPYLAMLPNDAVPRLDTFGNEELDMLQDEQLAFIAKESYQQLQLVWKSSDLQAVLAAMMAHASKKYGETITSTSSFFAPSFQDFHKYVSIVSSRAMVLHGGEKHLTPLAGMINYSPRSDFNKRRTESSSSFALYHQKDEENGAITVRADRNVYAGEQIFEDYGELDNSLYLEAHGFVPDENPFHCAIIHAKYLPSPTNNIKHAALNSVLEALVALDVFPFSPDKNAIIAIPDVCVMADGSVVDDRAASYLKVASLMVLQEQELRQSCIQSLDSQDFEAIVLRCIHYPGHKDSLRQVIQTSARFAMCDADTSLPEDLALLESMLSQDEGISNNNVTRAGLTRKLIALKFRISDKKILWNLGEMDTHDCSASNNDWG